MYHSKLDLSACTTASEARKTQKIEHPLARKLVPLYSLHEWLYPGSEHMYKRMRSMNDTNILARLGRAHLCCFTISMDYSNLDLSTCATSLEAWKTQNCWRASGAQTFATSQPQTMTISLIWIQIQQDWKHTTHKKIGAPPARKLVPFQKNGCLHPRSEYKRMRLGSMNDKKMTRLRCALLCYFTTSMNDSILDLSIWTRGWETWKTNKETCLWRTELC